MTPVWRKTNVNKRSGALGFQHMDKERTLLWTWSTPEFQNAVTKRYTRIFPRIEFTSELDNDDRIVKFVSGGPKNYGYQTHKGKVECRVRGFRLNS